MTSFSKQYPSFDQFLPTSVKEMKALGWEYVDVVIFSGDAYVDHPSFGAAVIGRTLQSQGYKVAIVPQPNWKDDLRDFKKFGAPRLFFGISPGAMDSMVNHYTAARRRRSDDAYTPDARHGARPDYPTIVYSQILRQQFPTTPIIAGGIEASMRRLSHYDYWQDRLRPSILVDSAADLLIYGMGERPIVEIASRLDSGENIGQIKDVLQTVTSLSESEYKSTKTPSDLILHSYEECMKSKIFQAENFRVIEQESNAVHGRVIWQKHGNRYIRVMPMYPPMTTSQLDAAYDLPYTRLPHPRYKGKRIPAYEMIRHSVTLHRGCFGGCAFCTISAHQGKFISSRSERSIIQEIEKIVQMPDFKGYISDLGGPSANMYMMGGRNLKACEVCRRPSCLHPKPCPNLNNNHTPLLKLYDRVDKLAGVKKSFVSSGVRYDLAMHQADDGKTNSANRRYIENLIEHHVSGRLKVAPEHTSPHVLDLMRKPDFELYHRFSKIFKEVNTRKGLNQQIIPYFISSHPGCSEIDMAQLAIQTKGLGLKLEQIQDFTPTPMTLSTEIYYTGINPYTMQPVYTATTPEQKKAQRKYFFWYDPEYRQEIIASLRRLGRIDLSKQLFPTEAFTARKKH